MMVMITWFWLWCLPYYCLMNFTLLEDHVLSVPLYRSENQEAYLF